MKTKKYKGNTRKNKKTKKRRGGKTKGDWENGFWSEEPKIHARFITTTGKNKPECGYSLFLNYHYLDEDDTIPLELPIEEDGDGKINQIEKIIPLQIFTDSEAADIRDKKKIIDENLLFRNCTLSEKEILKLLKENPYFKKKLENGKTEIVEMVKADQEQKERIKSVFQDKRQKVNTELEHNIEQNKKIKEIFDKRKKK